MDVVNLADKFRRQTNSPRSTEHPVALTDEVHVLLLEPKGTLNTGNVTNDRTVADLDRI